MEPAIEIKPGTIVFSFTLGTKPEQNLRNRTFKLLVNFQRMSIYFAENDSRHFLR